MGFIGKVFEDKEAMLKGLIETAKLIASKSPVAVYATKASLINAIGPDVDRSLEHLARMQQTFAGTKVGFEISWEFIN